MGVTGGRPRRFDFTPASSYIYTMMCTVSQLSMYQLHRTVYQLNNAHRKCRGMLSPCNALYKHGLCHHVVSVCLSHVCILSKQINISSIFSPMGSQTFLVFPYQAVRQQSRMQVGHEKTAIYDEYLACSHVVNATTVRYYQHSAAGPWQVHDTHH